MECSVAFAVAPLQLGPLTVDPPVVLAPMAGVTNYPFRRICRDFGAPLCVSEMVLASMVARPNRDTLQRMSFGPDERPRSIQLYGVEPNSLREATERLVDSGQVEHIDLNFGCPMRKVTSKGGGAAICAKPKLLARLVSAVTGAAGSVPVTAKFRVGLDDNIITFVDAARACEAEGCAAVGLHARTAQAMYSGRADWRRIAALVNAVDIPVLGNGDIFSGDDARRMLEETGCAGVIVGRGCLGYPWLFREIADALNGQPSAYEPTFDEARSVLLRHASMSVAWAAEWSTELAVVRSLRRVVKWYLTQFVLPEGTLRRALTADSYRELAEVLHAVDAGGAPHTGAERASLSVQKERPQRVVLPQDFFRDTDGDYVLDQSAEGDTSCG